MKDKIKYIEISSLSSRKMPNIEDPETCDNNIFLFYQTPEGEYYVRTQKLGVILSIREDEINSGKKHLENQSIESYISNRYDNAKIIKVKFGTSFLPPIKESKKDGRDL